MHETATLVTFAIAVPLPLETVQVCPEGWLDTVTAYAEPEFTTDEKANDVALAATLRLLPPLFCNVSPEPVSPLTVPPIV
jgi:hypothetical protein